MNLKFILFIIIFLCPNVHAVEYIGQQDGARIKAFSKDDRGEYLPHRSRDRALPYTQNISNRLTDHANIDYNRTATVAEREVIYKAMMGSVIIHDTANYKKVTYGHAGYNSHFDALQAIDDSIRQLWQGVQSNRYIHSLEQITGGTRHQALLTNNFIKWFYEALESYKHELNFFGGAASVDWFQQVSSRYSDAAAISGENIKILFTESAAQIGMFKALENTSGKETGRDRQVKAEYMSWLLAKAAGLIRVVNPVIPVRIKGDHLVIDPENYEGTLEPFVGVPVRDYPHGYPRAMDNYPTQFRQLFSRFMNYSSMYTINFTKEYGFSPFDELFSYSLFGFSPSAALNRSRKEKILDLYLPRFNISSRAVYFSKKGQSFPQLSKYGFIENLASVSRTTQYQDLELFNRSIDPEDLLSLVVFWHLTLQDDMNASNILFRPTEDGRIITTVIDYDVSMGNTGPVLKRVPTIYPLAQSAQSLGSAAKNRVSQISATRITQVMQAYQYRRKPSQDTTKAFGSTDQTNLLTRLATIKQTVNGSTTVRQVMHGLIPEHFEGLQFQVEQNLLGYHKICNQTLNCTVVAPLLATKRIINTAECAGSLFNETKFGARITTAYLYPLEYVFSADRNRFLQGENDGTNLNGYLPFTNDNLLWGLGI